MPTELSKVTSATEELGFKFHLILINVNLNSQMWLLSTVLDSTTPKSRPEQPKRKIIQARNASLICNSDLLVAISNSGRNSYN